MPASGSSKIREYAEDPLAEALRLIAVLSVVSQLPDGGVHDSQRRFGRWPNASPDQVLQRV